MSFITKLQRAHEILEQQGRLSTRALERELEIAGDELDELIEELVDVQQIARREGKILVWAGASSSPPSDVTIARESSASTPTHRPTDQAEARKVVTIIFADLIGSTSLHERLDAESTHRLMDHYYRALHAAVEAHGGTVVKLMGDGVMAAFGVPRVAEDDAVRAVRAGVAMQDAFRELARNEFAAVGDIGLRVGINTGEVVVSADNTDVVGDPVNVAARLQQEAHDGEVVIGEPTRRLVAALVTLVPLGSVALKGRAEAMKAYRVESLDRPVGAATAAFVGRADELGRIAAVYDAAVAVPAARLAVLLGSPGLGKSRMIEEFTRRLGDVATVLTAQCDAEGGATFAPLAEALRELLRRKNRGSVPLLTKEGEEGKALRLALEAAVPGTDAERARIIDGITALLAGSPASPEETFFVVRRLLAALAAAKPVVLVIDDLHWAEPLLLDLVEHLVQWGSGVRLLVLVGARPELRDARSSLATSGGVVADVVTLAGLDAGAATRLAANVIGAADLPAAIAAKVLATSEGNPLFVAELVRMLVQEGALKQEGDRWITGVGLAALEMPPTIHALLAARIERLRPEERSVLERAAVIGRHFSRSAVAALLPREVTDLDARLEALRRSELVEPDTGWFLGEPVLRFHHVLIRDAAYRRLLKGTRVELHERVANWIESRAPDSVEHDETLGWHLEQAHQFVGELGPIDAPGRALGERAARHLAAAGRRALARDDLPVAAGLLGRALDRLNANDPARAELALDWCEALLAAGDVGTAAKAIDELGRFIDGEPLSESLPLKKGGQEGFVAESSDQIPLDPPFSKGEGGSSNRLRAWHTCFTGQLTALTAPQSLHATADAVAAAAAELAALGDTAGEAKAHFVHAQAFARLGKIGACEAALDRALAAARRAGDRRRANTVLAVAPLAALWGPSPVTRASGRCLDVVRVLRITQGAPAVEAVALSCQGVLEALRGRTDAARRMIASARKMVEELGITQRLLEADVFAGRIELLEGDAAAAERCLRGAYEGLRDLGLGIDAARAAALLGRALLAQDRAAEAEALSRESEALAGDDLQASIAWRGVRAEALARGGDHIAAVELAKAAVKTAAATDALLDHADARLALAAALRAAGRSVEAEAEERRAIELWETKGATLLAERAHRGTARVEPVAPTPEDRAGPAAPVRPRVRANAETMEAAGLDAAASGGQAPSEALARLDELTGLGSLSLKKGGQEGFVDESFHQILPDPPFSKEGTRAQTASAPVRRRVRPNEVIAFWARFDAVFAAGDADAIDASFSDAFAEIDHTTGASYGRDGALASIHRLRRAPDAAFQHEPLATLGPSLGLVRGLISASGTGGGRFDVGAYEIEEIKVTEVDERRQLRSAEVFARERLGDAIARLYERYAELLPDGLARQRGAATARSVAWMLTSSAARDGMAFSTTFEAVDHRTAGYGAIQRSAAKRAAETWREFADGFSIRIDDVLALSPNALLRKSTNSGVWREGGGVSERSVCALSVFGPDGLVVRHETFDADREADALARFDELVGSGSQPEPNPLAPFPNAATRFCDRFVRAWAAGDWAAVTALHSAAHHNDDRRRLMQMRVAAEANLTQLRTLFDVPRSRMAMTPVATRGERLALSRILYEGDSDGGGGTLAIDYLGIVESVGDDRLIEIVLFDPDDLDAAYAELEARYDAGEGAAYAVHGAVMRAFARAIASRDWDPVVALCSPTLVEYDHRALAVLGTTRGAEAWVQNFRTLTNLAPDTVYRVDHFRSCARGFCSAGTWRGSREGGTYEIPLFAVIELDEHDRMARADIFDQFDQVHACFQELALSSGPRYGPQKRGSYSGQSEMPVVGSQPLVPSSGRSGPRIEGFANAATRAVDRGTAALAARDWERFAALFATGFRHYDRTRMAQLDTDGREWLASFRRMVEMTTGPPTQQVLATRGERLALFRVVWRGAEGDIGPSEIDWVLIVEVDGHGDHVAVVAFDPDDLDAAYAELDARWEAGEAALHPHAFAWVREFRRAFAARDWQAMAALHAPEQVAVNHRTVGWGTLRGPGAWVPTLQALVELATDARFRLDHLRTRERGILWQSAWQGTRDGGPFETPLLVATELDDHGRQIRMDVWDADVFEPACARFAEMTTAPVARPQRFANAATATTDPLIARLVAHDWQGFEHLFSEDFRCSDRRRVVQLEFDRDQYVAFTREVSDGRTIRGHSEVIATRGNRLALNRSAYEFTDADVGPSEIAFLILTEVDDRGRIVAYVRWDLEDLDAAYAELEARWEAGEGAAHPLASKWIADYQRFFAARDWNAMAAILAPDLVSHNHRLISWGTLDGPAGLVSTMQAQMELAPDTQVRVDHVRTCAGGLLLEYAWHGTREGGAFENILIAAVELDALGRPRRIEVWEAEQLEQARARFGEIEASRRQPLVPSSGPPANTPSLDTAPKDGAYSGRTDIVGQPFDGAQDRRIEGFANAATRAWSQLVTALRNRDWQRVASLRAADFRFFDRTPMAHLELDGDEHLDYIRSLGDMNVARMTQDVLATRGDRLALARSRVEVAGGEVGPSEIVSLFLTEINALGEVQAYVRFEGDNLDAAYAELDARWAAGEATAYPRPSKWLADYLRFFAARDWNAMTALFASELVGENHRLVGWGTLRGPAAVVSTLQAQVELAPDTRERVDHVRTCAHAVLLEYAWYGTREGGAFENLWVVLVELDADGRAHRADVWEAEQIEQAHARFEALRLDPLRIPPNVATRARDQVNHAFMSKDWDAMRALATDELVFEDRRHWAMVSGGVQLWIKSSETVQSETEEVAFQDEVIATVGDRIELRRRVLTGIGPDGAAFESELIVLTEVDAEGKIVASINFDVEARAAASADAQERFVVGEAAAVGGQTPILKIRRM